MLNLEELKFGFMKSKNGIDSNYLEVVAGWNEMKGF